jgi:hypothetical protein
MEQVFYMYSIDILQVFYSAEVYARVQGGVFAASSHHVFRFFRLLIFEEGENR